MAIDAETIAKSFEIAVDVQGKYPVNAILANIFAMDVKKVADKVLNQRKKIPELGKYFDTHFSKIGGKMSSTSYHILEFMRLLDKHKVYSIPIDAIDEYDGLNGISANVEEKESEKGDEDEEEQEIDKDVSKDKGKGPEIRIVSEVQDDANTTSIPVIADDDANVNSKRDQDIAQRIEEAFAKCRVHEKYGVSVADFLKNMFDLEGKSLENQINQLQKGTENISAFTLSDYPNVKNKMWFGKPNDIIRAVARTPLARKRGWTDISTNEYIRKIGGDESLHQEIESNRNATKGTLIAQMARSSDVGSTSSSSSGSSSSSSALIHPSSLQTYSNQTAKILEHFVYIAMNHELGLLKIGETMNLSKRNSTLQGLEEISVSILFALRINNYFPTANCKAIESMIHESFRAFISKKTKDYLDFHQLREKLDITDDDDLAMQKVAWYIFQHMIAFASQKNLLQHCDLYERSDCNFIPITESSFISRRKRFGSSESEIFVDSATIFGGKRKREDEIMNDDKTSKKVKMDSGLDNIELEKERIRGNVEVEKKKVESEVEKKKFDVELEKHKVDMDMKLKMMEMLLEKGKMELVERLL
ncbi:hypothetical protein M427DRAFT_44874 [Gonapodya prolifera JEL478]|uniref:Bacteriophage T5 Orf172 DNA-binding domain-containing protein n=1 Tax=Gonapodya prolifera (strain JEL478) TaxID=1344416 RepID=A0A139AD27_GONPJ|nr:hypothetical protein M427DRAFT_44874 [Gonapodya prolifera JEL478]|eukprot:KXS14677.1 hypothetical protein M427DRAFT_44874 [Gonapodya prolifera JEL478]